MIEKHLILETYYYANVREGNVWADHGINHINSVMNIAENILKIVNLRLKNC